MTAVSVTFTGNSMVHFFLLLFSVLYLPSCPLSTKFLINIKDCETLGTVRAKVSQKRKPIPVWVVLHPKREMRVFFCFICIPILSLCQPRLSVCNRYNMHGRPICMGFTRRAVVNPIQIGREHCILLKIRLHLYNYVNQLFWWYGIF